MITRRTLAAMSAIVALATLSACTSSTPAPASGFDDWYGQQVLEFGAGHGGAGAVGPANITLADTAAGEYDIVATCEGADTGVVTLSVGDRQIVEIDLVCGEPVELTEAVPGDDVIIAATGDDDMWWFISLHTPGDDDL